MAHSDDPTEFDPESPRLGDSRDGFTLVCFGDDRPEQWVPWLEEVVLAFENLIETADRFDFELEWQDTTLLTWRDFCEALGVSFDQEFWEGNLTSGRYLVGWIDSLAFEVLENSANELVTHLERTLLDRIRTRRLEELARIDDLEEFLARTENDRGALLWTISRLEGQVLTLSEDLKRESNASQEEQKTAALRDCRAFDREILQFACDVFTRRPPPFHAGPLALWHDCAVYAIVRKGKGELPADSSAVLLLSRLEAADVTVHRVVEETKIAAGLGGPYYRNGSPHASQWTQAWREEPRLQRNFRAKDPTVAATASAIAKEFASWEE